jgi:hypothetical protein
MKGDITICRTQSSHGGQFMSIRVTDDASHIGIVELKMSLEEFARCITGQFSECEITRVPTPDTAAKFGLKKDHKRVFCEKAGYQKDEQKARVLQDFQENWEPLGWSINDDGTGTQQPSKEHGYSICRWIGKEEA